MNKKYIMKTIKSIINLMRIIILFASCTQNNSTTINEKSSNRIKVKEQRMISGYRYTILEIDGNEYLTQDQGGFVKLEKESKYNERQNN